MWATSLLTMMLLFPLLSAAPLDIAVGVEDDNAGLHGHDENVTRRGKHFSHNEFDFSVSVEGDVGSIGHEVNIDVHTHTDDHHHHEDDTVIECKKEIRVLFKSIDSNSNGIMDAKELLRVCHQNNFQVTESSAVRILTLPDKTVGFKLAKFCELLKDCPSTNRADLIYFLLELYDKVTCPHKDHLSDVLLENNWRTQNQINAMSENMQRNTVIAEVKKMTGHTTEDLQGRANAGDLGSLTAIANMAALLIKDSIKISSDVETMAYSDLRNALIVEANQQFSIEVGILQSMTDRQLLKTFCTGCEVHVGKSTSNTISATVTEGCVCPTVVKKGNWLVDGTYPEEFKVTQDGSSLQVQRTDSDIGWSMDLSFMCKRGCDTCPAVWSPVCGVDGKTYSNTCKACGIEVACEGLCPCNAKFPCEFDDGLLTPQVQEGGQLSPYDTSHLFKWENNVIPYYYTNQKTTDGDKALVRSVMDRFEAYTCFTFIEEEDDLIGNKHRLLIEIEDESCRGGIAGFVMKAPYTQQKLLLKLTAHVTNENGYDECGTVGLIIHELMHVVGVGHTQRRNDRDKFIRVNLENLDGANQLIKDQYKKCQDCILFDRIPYDCGSIMHYGTHFKGKEVIEPKDKETCTLRKGPLLDLVWNAPAKDWELLNIIGNCKKEPTSVQAASANIHYATEMPNIGKLFQGYDIMKGNPLPVAADNVPVDPGFRQDIFEASYFDGSMTPDRRYLRPDGITISSCTACSLNFGTKEISGSKSYQESLARKVGLSVGGSIGAWGGKFSASYGYKEVAEKTSFGSNLFTQSSASCCAYSAEMLSFKLPSLSQNFRYGVDTLTEKYDERIYLNFIEAFGTHFIRKVLMGALYGEQTELSKEAWTTLQENGIDISTAAKLSSAYGVTGSTSFESSENKKAAEFSEKSKNQKTFTIGVKPPADGRRGTWLQKTISDPAPIDLTLGGSILDLLEHDDIKHKVSTVVKENLKQALDDYCDLLHKLGEAKTCSPPGPDPAFPSPASEPLKMDASDVPYLRIGSKWMPICGLYFWDNNIGADIVCRNLGYSQGGVVQRVRGLYSEDAYYVGRCDSKSVTDLEKGCTKEYLLESECKKGNRVSIKVKCQGPPACKADEKISGSACMCGDTSCDVGGICTGGNTCTPVCQADVASGTDCLCGDANCAAGSTCVGGSTCIAEPRCRGINNFCCTKDNPCKEQDGDCDWDSQCLGDLKCGDNNCPWGEGDDCCYKPGVCNGKNDGCCTKDTPCKEADGDCDNNDECEGDLKCGTNNCPWFGFDDCCYKP